MCDGIKTYADEIELLIFEYEHRKAQLEEKIEKLPDENYWKRDFICELEGVKEFILKLKGIFIPEY